MYDVVVIEYENDDENPKTIFGKIDTGIIINIIKINNLSESGRRGISIYGYSDDNGRIYIKRNILVDRIGKRVQMFERIKKLERLV